MAAAGRVFWLFVLVFHAVAAAGWWWLAPGGFAVAHPRFWTNRVAPPLVLVAVAAALRAMRGDRRTAQAAILVGFPAAWGAGAVSAVAAFPATAPRLIAVPLALAALMGLACYLAFRRGEDRSRGGLAIGASAGMILGAALPLGFLPPAAATRPSGGRTTPAVRGIAPFPGTLGDRTFVSPGDGSATIRIALLRITVQPLLRFLARSPDGAPTALVPASLREGPGLRLVAAATVANGVDLRYRADYEAALFVEEAGGATRMEARAFLPSPIWSHLNGFCDVDVSGHRRLFLAFSPCPDVRIEVRPMDYPFGRPLRFAFLDASGRFRVVEATSGEKGPFRELASGPLRRGDPLAIDLFDEDRAVARVVLDDWSEQVDVQPSPTAGWGAPANAIEFSLSGDEPASSASLYISLASTSVGRGWDCLGHRAGSYRNRVRVEPAGASR
ncbi:MAG: hypothetical protein BGO49_01110 [Planctomycetales bacterium 71-10]|nr:MAG: hypothetical protein BGO49_01110 [Planctomycetales bacterium 71-10]